jgi:hypothetical protein
VCNDTGTTNNVAVDRYETPLTLRLWTVNNVNFARHELQRELWLKKLSAKSLRTIARQFCLNAKASWSLAWFSQVAEAGDTLESSLLMG